MSDIMQKINEMLKGNNVPDSIKSAMNELKSNASESSSHNTNSNFSSETLQNFLQSLSSQTKNTKKEEEQTSETTNSIDFETIMKMKNIMEKLNHSPKDDPRANLLLSLKPYLRKGRKEKVDQYVKFLNMGKIIDVLKTEDSGGDSHDV